MLSKLPSKASYLRHMIVYGFVYDIDYSELKDYNYQLSQIGKNINQIARKVDINNAADSSDIKEIKELMDKIWHIQRSMLSKQPLIRQ